MFRDKFIAAAAPLLLLLLFPVSGFTQESADCISCHNSMKGRIKAEHRAFIELNVNDERFKASVHGALPCTECHIRFAGSAGSSLPANLLSLSAQLSSKFKSDAVAGASCIACHEETYQQVLSSVHGKNIIEKKQTDRRRALH